MYTGPRAPRRPFWPAWDPPPAWTWASSNCCRACSHVHRITAPYKLAGRAFRPQGTVVEFPNGAKIGGEQVAVIAGPCAIESREQIFAIAGA